VTHNDESYVNPALSGMEAAAFTAAAMLYRVFTGAPPFSNGDISILHQDMRDNNFLPLRFAVPGLEPRLAALIMPPLSGLRPPLSGAFLSGAPLSGLALTSRLETRF